VAARFERYIRRRSARLTAAAAQCIYFRVRPAEATMPTLAQHALVAYEHAADHRIRFHAPLSAQRQLQGAPEVLLVVG
jgi:hypothetical protein